MTQLTQLTCEYRNNPLGIDVRRPRLSWQLNGQRRGIRQQAYQILAAASEEYLHRQVNLLWDSGRVESDQSIQVVYDGPDLVSGQRIYWQVVIWDDLGERAKSASAWWEMGLLESTDWQAGWIGAPFWGGPRTSSPAPYLRKEFQLRENIKSARLYATALGLYECYLNGQRIGEDLLTPGWTDYTRHIQYQTYDVRGMVREGANALGAILGDGWAAGHIAWLGRQHYVDRPRLLAQLVVTYVDGSREVITSGPDWKCAQGALLEADFLMGESYDARREFKGWAEAGFKDHSWWAVEVFEANGAQLVATNGPTVRRQETLKPIMITKVPGLKPRWIFDFGQNLVGWVRVCASGERGSTLILRHAEVLNPDGSLYVANLRTARSTDHYTLKGEGEEIWEPRFTFHGFRYVELAGYQGVPTEETLTGVVIHSEMAPGGSFECSDPLINQLQHNILWGQKGNFVDVPTDCPQRDERLGWTGDAQVFIRTAAFNHEVAGFFTKWTRDLEDSQYINGVYPSVAPNLAKWTIGEGGPAWADAGVICPWTIYQCYGDKRILEERYDSMKRFIGFLKNTSRDGLRCYPEYPGWHGNGDWLALDGSDGREGGTSKELIGTAFHAHSCDLMARIARVLGKHADAAEFDEISAEARHAFNRRFVHADGSIEGGTQTSYVLALEFDLLPEKLRPLAAAELVRSIRQRDDHLSTGFVGTPYLNHVLTQNGYLEVAYALVKQTTWPSWLYSVTQGATTIWERWDAWTHDKGFQDPKMNSFNHYAYGAIGAWMYATIGGIDLDPRSPGYQHIVMHPRPGGGITHATTSLPTPYGIFKSAWVLRDGQMDWQVSVPANASASLHLPATDASQVTESGIPLPDAAEIRIEKSHEGFVVVNIGSGEYYFKCY